MPSPITHTAIGYVVHRIFRPDPSKEELKRIGPVPYLLLATMGLALLPDLDAIPGIILGNLKQFHNNLTHSLVMGLVVAVAIGSIVWLRQRSGFGRWFMIVLLCYELHVIMDYFTFGGRGVMLFWPLTMDRFDSSIKLFYGLRWSEGLIHESHLWTLVTEVGFVLLTYFVVELVSKRVSLDSLKATE